MPYGITQCYLPPGRGDIPAFTPAKADTRFSDPRGMQGWVDLGGWLEMVYPLDGHCCMVWSICRWLYIVLVIWRRTNCSLWYLMLGSHTPQSGMLPRDTAITKCDALLVLRRRQWQIRTLIMRMTPTQNASWMMTRLQPSTVDVVMSWSLPDKTPQHLRFAAIYVKCSLSAVGHSYHYV